MYHPLWQGRLRWLRVRLGQVHDAVVGDDSLESVGGSQTFSAHELGQLRHDGARMRFAPPLVDALQLGPHGLYGLRVGAGVSVDEVRWVIHSRMIVFIAAETAVGSPLIIHHCRLRTHMGPYNG
ncbi:Glycosyltransferase family 2 [Trichuris trichiura]|uniref:Glycosyltransferase family 2 n=1 Tax=Trichuris trichiura TaxID=36087 RepID=A0A077ZJ08_TRITR|nr:Glycosyltransferase family 2 [Trichuris trichiura]